MKRIFSITHHTYFPDNDDILIQLRLEKFNYEFTPVVIYAEKTLGNASISPTKMEQPLKVFSLYEAGTSISLLKRYFGPDFKKDELVVVRRAFQKLKNFALPCAERVTADLCCQIIIRTIKETKKDEKIIYFVEKSATDKMLGRLGSLCLDLTNITICFLSYEPDDLMTTVMSSQTGKLHFDIHRLMQHEISGKFGPYPGAPEDAIKQTYFYKHPSIDTTNEFLPIRFDIFAQGLLEDKIEEKSEEIISVFNNKEERIPYPIGKSYILLPIGFEHAKKAWKDRYSKEYIKNELAKK